MLTIATIECSLDDAGGTAGAAGYVLGRSDRPAAFARGAYYAGDDEGDRPAIWHGSPEALGQLGLEAGRAVTHEELVAALLGQHAETGVQVRRPGTRTVERDGEFVPERIVKSVDLTFSVPKSVSVAWSQASPEERARIEADVLDAARETVDFMATQKACVHRRNEDGVRVREPAVGVAAALSLHVTARRAEDDFAPAPQLHVHSVVVGVLRNDGRLVTPATWKWFRDNGAREGGALGRAYLADRLGERGYAIESETGRHRRYFELRDVPQTLRDAFSGRSREVATRARALELATGRKPAGAALAVLAKETRTAKTTVDHDAVLRWWDAIAAEHGFGPREADALIDPRGHGYASTERAVAEAIMRRLADEGPTVSTTEARCIALECAAGRLPATSAMHVLKRLEEVGMVIPLQHDRVTTRPIRDLERQVLRAARSASHRTASPLPDESIAAGIATAQDSLGSPLDSEQHAAVLTLCDGTGWGNLTGRAGTGKGPVLHAVSAAYQHAGWQVLACAVDGTTAQRLAAQVKGTGYTVDGLTARIRHGHLRPTDRTLIVVDEASKVDTARWADLARIVTDNGTRIVTVGDEGQLQSVELPGLYPEIQKHAPTVELTDIRRHRDPADPEQTHPWLTDYQALLHAGHGHEAIAVLQEHDAVRMHDTRAEAMVALVDGWNAWRHDHPIEDTMLLVHGTNADVDTVNILAQQRRLAAGELGTRSAQAPDREYSLHEGDLVMVRAAPLRTQAGERVENGTLLRVEAVTSDHTVQVRLARAAARQDSFELDLRLLQGAGGFHNRTPSLRLAYAMHPNPAQGATVARTASLGHPVADRNASYVADTRAKYGHTLHLAREDLGEHGTDDDRLQRLATTIANSRAKDASVRYRPRNFGTGRDPER